jgi:SagB-type dehydrogenase family enzyme
MRLKVSERAVLFWDNGQLVWDDYVHHQQHVLTAHGEWLCRWFGDWRDADSIEPLLDGAEGTTVRRLLSELVAGEILIIEGSDQHKDESRMLDSWREWATAARYYHYATRTLGTTPCVLSEDDEDRLAEKARTDPPPPVCRSFPGRPFVPVADPPSWQSLRDHSLLDVLTARRTARRFAVGSVSIDELGALFSVALDPSHGGHSLPGDAAYGTVFKTSPSGGARHPIETYLHANRVSGLPSGFHHYNTTQRGFEDLGLKWTNDQIARSAADQLWVSDAAAVIYYTAALDRSRWKYDLARCYRVIMMDLGHLSQTIYLAATALGLAVGFTAALRDELVEQALGCDPDHEIALAVTALGRKTGLDPAQAALARTSSGK